MRACKAVQQGEREGGWESGQARDALSGGADCERQVGRDGAGRRMLEVRQHECVRAARGGQCPPPPSRGSCRHSGRTWSQDESGGWSQGVIFLVSVVGLIDRKDSVNMCFLGVCFFFFLSCT